MSALPKGWVTSGAGFYHVSGVSCLASNRGVYMTHPDAGEHPTLDAAIAALEPHVEAWRAAVREAVGQTASAQVAAEPVAAERDPLVDPRPGDGIEAVTPAGEMRRYDVAIVEDGRVWYVERIGDGESVLDNQPLEAWCGWFDWTVTVVRRGAP